MHECERKCTHNGFYQLSKQFFSGWGAEGEGGGDEINIVNF